MKLYLHNVKSLYFVREIIIVVFVDAFIYELMSPRKGVHVNGQMTKRQNPRNYVASKISLITDPRNLMLTKYIAFTLGLKKLRSRYGRSYTFC